MCKTHIFRDPIDSRASCQNELPKSLEQNFEKFHSGIKNRYYTLAYPQSTKQAEITKKVIVDVLKKRLEEVKGKWVDELPHVLWAYHTTPRRLTRETPFPMTYGSEAVIPLKTGILTMRND